MFGRSSIKVMGGCAASMLCGCAADFAPSGWLDPPTKAQSSGYGGWIELSCGLIISVPVWLIAGISSASVASREPLIRVVGMERVRPYARFPDGLPENLDRTRLKPKPFGRQ